MTMTWRRIAAALLTGLALADGGSTVLAAGAAGIAAGPPAETYPAPRPLVPVTGATLSERYDATARAVRGALAVADDTGDQRRGAALAGLLGRQLLEFDPRGQGRVVEVVGDLARADRIAVMVPGSHSRLDTFDRPHGPGGAARAQIGQIRAVDPDATVAVVAWLGYDTPQGFGPQAITDRLAPRRR